MIVFSLGVAGVAFATVIAQVISAVLVLRCLMQADSIYQLNLKKLRIVPNKLAAILYIGFPAGLQSCIFAISNTLIQSTVNSFGSIAIAGNTAAANLEAFTYTSMNAFSQTAMSFAGQNYGARKYKRILKIALICSGTVALVGVLMSIFFLSFAEILLRLYSVEPEVIRHGLLRMRVMYAVYFLCGMMEVVGGAIRGMGHSIVPMLASIIGGCLFRVFWIYLIFPHFKSLQVLYISYPVSWGLTLVIYGICFTVIYRRCASQDNV